MTATPNDASGARSRPVAPAPRIPGFEFVDVLGSGGFADVYLYEQQLPRRLVAAKVLLANEFSEQALDSFEEEANLMAQLSTHPSIVTIHHAGHLDDGRRCIVMEYCPGPSVGDRYRAGRFAVPEVLSIGVRIAGATETAHRSGVLHRDIKPSNILFTAYGHPALTDFGVSSTLGRAAAGSTVGVSIPWAPPEALDASWSGPASDVYSLGATLYSLLAGRSPFERNGGDNTAPGLASRIRDEPLTAIERADVPASLEQVLRTAMAKSPPTRFTSALSLARALQRVEEELSLPVTQVDVLSVFSRVPARDDRAEIAGAPQPPAEDESVVGMTAVAATIVAPGQGRPTTTVPVRGDEPALANTVVERPTLQDPPAEAIPAAAEPDGPSEERRSSGIRVRGLVLDAVLVLGVVGALVALLLTG